MLRKLRKRRKATARHILVQDAKSCEVIKQRIEEGEEFETMASAYSNCPSGSKGGDLGTFCEHKMVKPFNEVVFSGELNELHGPVKTKFGYHLIEVSWRSK